MIARVRMAWLLALALSCACGKSQRAGITQPPASDLGPHIVATSPPARSERAPYDAPIWVQFDGALQAASVGTHTVFLKVDTRRQPIRITYEPFTFRILIQPDSVLRLLQTYTVELSPELKTLAGERFGRGQSFQFTTNGIRRLRGDSPTPGQRVSPFAQLRWSHAPGQTGSITYQLASGTDSSAVIARQVPLLATGAAASYIQRGRWPEGTTVYWAVRALRTDTGEVMDGPLHSFETFESTAPIDSVTLPLLDWGGLRNAFPRSQLCSAIELPIREVEFNSAIRWVLNGDRPSIQLAGGRIDLFATDAYIDSIPLANASVYYALANWNACQVNYPGPPTTDPLTRLATGRPSGGRRLSFQSDSLTSQLELMCHQVGWNGFVFKSAGRVDVFTSSASFAPKLTLFYYKPPPPPAAAVAKVR